MTTNCKEGFEMFKAKCVKKCKTDQSRSEDTGRCRKIAGAATTTPKTQKKTISKVDPDAQAKKDVKMMKELSDKILFQLQLIERMEYRLKSCNRNHDLLLKEVSELKKKLEKKK